jgi:imidazolonepropionase-like amidohydrolase
MDDHDSVVDDGVVYVRDGAIVAVQKANVRSAAGFEGVKVLETKGRSTPGLIDLHDHLSYNALQLWDVPKKYTNRDQWAQGDTYRKLITGPMKVLAHTPKYVPRSCATSSASASPAGRRPPRGSRSRATRGSSASTRASSATSSRQTRTTCRGGTHIADVEAKDREKFLKRLNSPSACSCT